MISVDAERWRNEVNGDPEFRIAARHWNADVKIAIGASAMLLSIREGRIETIDTAPTAFDPWDIEIAAAEEEWRRFLEPVPPPFYHDVFAASLHHGFRIGADLESFYAYYPAARRMLERLREIVR